MRKIEFYSDVYGLADTVPVIKPIDCLPKWVNIVRADYKQSDKDQTHLYRCPGIFDLFNHGYIVPAWHDISFKTDGENYAWEVPSKFQPINAPTANQSKISNMIVSYS